MIEPVLKYILELLLIAPTVLIALSFHECAHAFIAYKLGDPTAKYMGRLTLNPMKHFDPIGALCMLICHFGWAKAVPVNMMNFKNPKRGMALTALAGPTTNLILGFVGASLFSLCKNILPNSYSNTLTYVLAWVLLTFLFNFGYLNIFLAIFNLLPVPPFDGSRILGAFIPDRQYIKLMSYERIIGIVFFAVYFIDARFDGPISYGISFLVDIIHGAFCMPINSLFNLF
jgi:Zn-dependent protease